MDQISDTNGIWHVRFNQSSILPGGKRGQTPSGCPSWANLHQIEEWKQAGLICWDNESKTLSRLNGSDTLELIKLLQETDTWQQNGIPIQHLSRVSQYVYEKSAQERPIKNSPIGTPAQTAKPSTTTIRWIEDMRLPSEAGPQLIELLERNESAIKELAQREEEETKQALAKVYRILLTVHRRSAAKSIDLSKYSLKWQFDEQLNHLICNQLSK